MKPSIIFLLFIVVTSCNRYFKPVNTAAPSAAAIEKNISDGRTFILHDNSYAYEMTNVKITARHDSITGDVKRLANKIETRGSHKKVYYHYKHSIPEATVLNQVHLFTDQILTGKIPERHIAVSSFNKMHDLQFDKVKTTRNHIGTAVGIVAGVAVIAVILGSMASLSAFSLGPY